MLIPTSNQLTQEQNDQWRFAFAVWLKNFPSEHTRDAYGRDWSQFLEAYDVHPVGVHSAHVIAWRDKLIKDGWAETTVHRKLSSLSSFFESIKGTLRHDNPCENVQFPKVNPYQQARWLNDEQIRALLDIDTGTYRGARDRALFMMLITTANRRMSIADGDYVMQHHQLKMVGDKLRLTYPLKRGGNRTITLAIAVQSALGVYFEFKRNTRPSDPVFTHFDGQPLREHDINKICGEHGQRIGVDLHPHMLRHSAARKALRSKRFDANQIRSLTGHQSLRSLMIYLEAIDESAGDEIAAHLGSEFDV